MGPRIVLSVLETLPKVISAKYVQTCFKFLNQELANDVTSSQPINQPINQTSSQLIKQPIKQSINQSINQAVIHAINQSNNQWSPNNCLEGFLKVNLGLQNRVQDVSNTLFGGQNTPSRPIRDGCLDSIDCLID